MCQRASICQSIERITEKAVTSGLQSKTSSIISRATDPLSFQSAGHRHATFGTTARARLVEAMQMNSMQHVFGALICAAPMKPRSTIKERLGVGQVGGKEERKSQRELFFAISARKLKPVTTTTT